MRGSDKQAPPSFVHSESNDCVQDEPPAKHARLCDESELFVDGKESAKWQCSICFETMKATYADNAENPLDPRSEPCGHNYCLVSDA